MKLIFSKIIDKIVCLESGEDFVGTRYCTDFIDKDKKIYDAVSGKIFLYFLKPPTTKRLYIKNSNLQTIFADFRIFPSVSQNVMLFFTKVDTRLQHSQ